MYMKRVLSGICFSILLMTASAFAQRSTIEGYAADTNGKALKNAEVRIQQEKAKTSPVALVKTDRKGHFVAANLPAGTYTVSVLLDGTVKWSAAHVKTADGQVVHLNLSQHPAVAVAAANSQPKKRAVWVPDTTGSRLGGHWEDEPVRGPGTNDVDTMSTHQLDQMQRVQAPPPPVGGR
jgi:Carboxypeptidase regulatory-like domain